MMKATKKRYKCILPSERAYTSETGNLDWKHSVSLGKVISRDLVQGSGRVNPWLKGGIAKGGDLLRNKHRGRKSPTEFFFSYGL